MSGLSAAFEAAEQAVLRKSAFVGAGAVGQEEGEETQHEMHGAEAVGLVNLAVLGRSATKVCGACSFWLSAAVASTLTCCERSF